MSDEQKIKLNGHEVHLTNLGKIFWPKEKYTKGDLINYYRSVSDFILPHLKDRPESLHRHPNGINGKSFFQKDVRDLPPQWVKTKRIRHEDKTVNYLLVSDEASLVYLANLGCIEINPFNSRIGNLDRPDYAVIDLDPEDIDFSQVVRTAQVVHKILDNMKAPNYCKTSGATGLHIYVPLNGKYNYDQAKKFSQLVATLAYKKIPEITSLERMPKNRQGKVYLDYLQNNKGQTLASVYSVRPKPGATVSTPLEWQEIKKNLDPKKFTIQTVPKRLKQKGDIFKPILGKGVDLRRILGNIHLN